MRNLGISNPQIANPRRFGSLGSLISIISGILGLVLAIGAAPEISFRNNPIAILCCMIIAIAWISFFIPRIMSWGWKTKYFGVTSLHLAAFLIFCIIPSLCLICFSRTPLGFRVLILIASLALHFWWAHRFVLFYKRIYNDKILFDFLYFVEGSEVYYMQRVDKYLIENIFRLRQMPGDRYVVGFAVLGISTLFFADRVILWTGLPFVHSFLAIFTIPVSMMLIGLVTRGILIFYFYPAKIRRLSGKEVYVDMVALPEGFEKSMSEWKCTSKKKKLD